MTEASRLVARTPISSWEAAAAVADVANPTSLMQRVCDRTLELIPTAKNVAIGLASPDSIEFVSWAGVGTSPVGTRVDTYSSLSGLAIKTGQILRSDDTQIDSRVDAAACLRLAAISLVCVPLCQSNETYGVLVVNAPRTNAFTDAHVAILARLAEFVSVAVGSACDLDRASHELLNLGLYGPTTDETTSRYVMNVLNPDVSHRIDTRERIQQLINDPDLLTVVFQPIIDLSSSEVVAVEALARIKVTPIRPPDAWFDDAHRAGLGPELEMVAICRAVDHLHMLPDNVVLTINVGPETLVGARLEDALARIPARRVVLELTEQNAVEDYPGLLAVLTKLRSAGLRLAVDDAGNGYSSLKRILKLAPDFIKLDRYLISGIDSDPVRRALVTSLVTFAAETGAEILAEGIETKAELDVVRGLDVRYAQGYYLGRPAALDDLKFSRSTPVREVVGAAASKW